MMFFKKVQMLFTCNKRSYLLVIFFCPAGGLMTYDILQEGIELLRAKRAGTFYPPLKKIPCPLIF